MSTRKKTILTVLLSVVVALVLGEIAIRLFAPREYLRQRYYRGIVVFQCVEGNTLHHPLLGFFPKPNLDVRFDSCEFSTRVRTNSYGFRDDEASLADPQVVFLGDSFGFGWGVEEEETCEKFFEKRTGLSSLNMGVPGFGTVQQYELLRSFSEEYDLTDRTVVFLVFQNDLRDNTNVVGPLLPRIRKAGREAILTPAGPLEYFEETNYLAQKKWRSALSRSSCIGDLLVVGFGRLGFGVTKPRVEWTEPEGIPGFWVGRGESFELIFRRIQELCRERSLRLFAAYIPHLKNVESQTRHPDADAAAQVFRALDIPWIDLAETFTPEDYLFLDGHLTPVGNRKMADAVADALEDLGWIPRTASSAPVAASGLGVD